MSFRVEISRVIFAICPKQIDGDFIIECYDFIIKFQYLVENISLLSVFYEPLWIEKVGRTSTVCDEVDTVLFFLEIINILNSLVN